MRNTRTIVIEDRSIVDAEGNESIQSAGRDKGKTFLLTEMAAVQADEWVTQARFLIEQANRECNERGISMTDPFRALVLLRALKDPSLSSWWSCVKYQHHPQHPAQEIRQDAGCQIEEITTVNELITAVYELHTGFFSRESQSTLEPPSVVSTGSSATTISRPASGRSSQGNSRRFTS